MSFINALKESMNEEVVIIHDFMISYSTKNNVLHAFFEGKTDSSFYISFLRRFMPDNWHLKTYICKNKNSVYYYFNQLSQKHTIQQPLLFFVDKDIDNLIACPRPVDYRIYVTDYYSIENYIVTSESIEQLWSEIYSQPLGTKNSSTLIETFEKGLLIAQSIMIDIMAWFLMYTRAGVKPDLYKILIMDYLHINKDLEVRRTIETDDFFQLLDRNFILDKIDDVNIKINRCKEELLLFNPKEVIKGHLEMDFFFSFINELKTTIKVETKNKIKPKIEITRSNIVDILGPRVSIPESLSIFLSKHFYFEKTIFD